MTSKQAHVCTYCNRSFSRYYNLQTHVQNYHSNSSCYCDICDQNFGSPAGLQLHLSRGHNRYGQALPECDICGRIFARKQNITSHMISAHLQVQRPEIICSLCSKSFTTDRNLRRHVAQLHNPDYEYLTCDICKKIFKGKTSLIAHMQTVHSSSKDVFKCNQCDKIYTNKRNLKRHIEMHHLQKEEFKCMICPKAYSSNQSLKRHLRLHTSEKLDCYTCLFCSKTIFGTKNLKLHTALHHEYKFDTEYDLSYVKDAITCELCNSVFPEEMLLRQHIKAEHSFQDFYNYCKKSLLLNLVEEHRDKAKTAEYNCEFCSNNFCNVYDLKYHMRSSHDQEYALSTCNVCFTRFYTKETMAQHKKVCLPPANVNSCNHCDKLFTDISSLEFHIKVFHPHAQIRITNVTSINTDTFKCDHCNRMYNSERSLKHHIKLKHTLEKEVKCQICGRVCSNKYYLASHMKFVHNNTTWSKCHYCDKEFKTKRNIRRHIEFTHMGILRHKCIACETLFKEKRSLRKHVRIKHPNSNLFPQCHICKTRFESAKSCKIHLKLLHSFNMNTYPCGACTVSFTSKEALNIHMSTKHLEDKIYKCEECNLVFEGQGNFDKHNEMDHSNASNRKLSLERCILCIKDFSSRKTLKRHIKKFHKDFDEEELTNFSLRRRSFTIECQDCIKNFTDEYYYSIYLKIKDKQDSIVFKCETCKSSYKCMEYAVQRYKQNFDLSESKLYLSELCTAEMSDNSESTEPMNIKTEPPEEPQEMPDRVIKSEPLSP